MPGGGSEASRTLSRPTEKNGPANAARRRSADRADFSPRAKSRGAARADTAGSAFGASSGWAAAGEKAREPAARGRRTCGGETAKRVGGGYRETSEWRASAVKRGENAVDSENHARRSTKERSTKECRSRFDCNGPASAAPLSSADALAALQKRVQNAVQVILLR